MRTYKIDTEECGLFRLNLHGMHIEMIFQVSRTSEPVVAHRARILANVKMHSIDMPHHGHQRGSLLVAKAAFGSDFF